MHQNVQLDPDYIRTALRAHQDCAQRCRRWLETATTEEERNQALEQLQSALDEIQRWQAKL